MDGSGETSVEWIDQRLLDIHVPTQTIFCRRPLLREDHLLQTHQPGQAAFRSEE
jgi:hypothetical protein